MSIIIEHVRLSSKVLPIVGIVTLSLIMFLIERTPLSFEVKHVEVIVFLQEMDYPGLNVTLRMSEGTKFSVVALG